MATAKKDFLTRFEEFSDARFNSRKKYPNPARLYAKIMEYFAFCDSKSEVHETKRGIQFVMKPYTKSGLCIFLGMSGETFNNYLLEKDYREILLYALQIVENNIEEGMLNGKLNPISSMFALKNKFKWSDAPDMLSDTSINIKVITSDEVDVIDITDTKRLVEESGMNFDNILEVDEELG